MTDGFSIQVAQQIFEGLVEFNPKLEVIAAGAEALPTVSADGKTYTFKLRKDLKWTTGEPVTAKDYAYAWNRVAQFGDEAEYAFVFSEIDGFDAVNTEKDAAKRKTMTVPGIKVIDDYTLEVKLANPASYFLTEVALWSFWPVNQKALEAKGDKFDRKNPYFSEAANVVSNGPFILKEWKHDVSLRLEPSPSYVGQFKPSITAATVDIIKEDATAKLKYDNNELDDVQVAVADIQALKKDPKYKGAYLEAPSASIYYIVFNYAKENPFSKNIKLRQALSYAIDRQLVTDGGLNGSGNPTTVLIPSDFLGYKPLDTYPFNVDKAKAMLKEAGYDTPDKLKALADEINNFGGPNSGGLTYPSERTVWVSLWQNLQQQIKTNLGLDLKLNPVSTFKEYLDRVNKAEFAVYYGTWGADFPDPQNFYEPLYLTNAGINRGKYTNTAFDAAVKKGNIAATPQQRAESYQQAEKILQDDAAYIPLYNNVNVRLVRPTLQGYVWPSLTSPRWKYMSIKK